MMKELKTHCHRCRSEILLDGYCSDKDCIYSLKGLTASTKLHGDELQPYFQPRTREEHEAAVEADRIAKLPPPKTDIQKLQDAKMGVSAAKIMRVALISITTICFFRAFIIFFEESSIPYMTLVIGIFFAFCSSRSKDILEDAIEKLERIESERNS